MAAVRSAGAPERVNLVVGYLMEHLANVGDNNSTPLHVNSYVRRHKETLEQMKDAVWTKLTEVDNYRLPAGLTKVKKEELELAITGCHVVAYCLNTGADLNSETLEVFLTTVRDDMLSFVRSSKINAAGSLTTSCVHQTLWSFLGLKQMVPTKQLSTQQTSCVITSRIATIRSSS